MKGTITSPSTGHTILSPSAKKGVSSWSAVVELKVSATRSSSDSFGASAGLEATSTLSSTFPSSTSMISSDVEGSKVSEASSPVRPTSSRLSSSTSTFWSSTSSTYAPFGLSTCVVF